MWVSQPASLHTAKVYYLELVHSCNKKIIASLFLQTVNIIIIAKQPVFIQLKVFILITKKSFLAPRATEQDLSFRQPLTCSDSFDR